MLRPPFTTHRNTGENDFRWRGGEVSRIEALSDAVFALSLTLLIVSLEMPATFDAMLDSFRQVPAFAVSFAILMWLWHVHYRFHRRYGLEDAITTTVNAFLLFVILLYIYPLRFVFTLVFARAVGATGPDMIRDDQGPTLMLLYSAGFAVIFGLFALLYWRAWAVRERLELDERERLVTRAALSAHLLSTVIGATAVAIVLWKPGLAPWTGFAYFSLGPVHFLNGWLWGRRIERARPLE